MLMRIIAVGHKMPAWVTLGFQDYAKRIGSGFQLQLCEITLEKRTKGSDIARLIERESEKIIAAIKPNHVVVALDRQGKLRSTEQLAHQLQNWQTEGRSIDWIIGGPDGLSPTCLQKAHVQWSLSPLTLPHPLVRVILAEQLYRAISILQHHPYHRF